MDCIVSLFKALISLVVYSTCFFILSRKNTAIRPQVGSHNGFVGATSLEWNSILLLVNIDQPLNNARLNPIHLFCIVLDCDIFFWVVISSQWVL